MDYQRLGVFVVRILGLYYAVLALCNAFDLMVMAFQGTAAEAKSDRLGGIATCILTGMVTMALARPLGRLLGEDLEDSKPEPSLEGP
jgi:hypothetical protein